MKARLVIGALTLSASTLVGIALHEGYTDRAIIPVPGDVPTKGFGTTKGVKMGDKTTPTRALIDLLNDASEAEQAVKRCAPVPMYLHEFNAYVTLTYNIGQGAFCKSTLSRKLNAGDYDGACAEILRWDYAGGRKLRGLTLRREAEYKQCKGLS